MRAVSSSASPRRASKLFAPLAQQREIGSRPLDGKCHDARRHGPRRTAIQGLAHGETNGSSAFSTTVAAVRKIRDLARAYAAIEG